MPKCPLTSGETDSRSRKWLQVQVLSDPRAPTRLPGRQASVPSFSSVPGGEGAGGDLGTEGWGLFCPLPLSFDLPASRGVSGHLGFQMSFL